METTQTALLTDTVSARQLGERIVELLQERSTYVQVTQPGYTTDPSSTAWHVRCSSLPLRWANRASRFMPRWGTCTGPGASRASTWPCGTAVRSTASRSAISDDRTHLRRQGDRPRQCAISQYARRKLLPRALSHPESGDGCIDDSQDQGRIGRRKYGA